MRSVVLSSPFAERRTSGSTNGAPGLKSFDPSSRLTGSWSCAAAAPATEMEPGRLGSRSAVPTPSPVRRNARREKRQPETLRHLATLRPPCIAMAMSRQPSNTQKACQAAACEDSMPGHLGPSDIVIARLGRTIWYRRPRLQWLRDARLRGHDKCDAAMHSASGL
jgi:hypothetical protein